MKILIDNKLFKNMASQGIERKIKVLVEACRSADIFIEENELQLIYQWPTLIECLNLEALFDQFFKLDEQNKLFNFVITTLNSDWDKDLLVHLYDQIFVECLAHVKNLPEINLSILLEKIWSKQQTLISSHTTELIFPLLKYYEKYFIENPSQAMHDLILYLAWDRLCVNIAVIFEHHLIDVRFRQGLDLLKECILESFEHITTHKRTIPGFFRLLETLYAHEMRQENLQIHSEEEWFSLCQGVRALKQREDVVDVYYIDGALINRQTEIDKISLSPLTILTIEPKKNVESALSLAHCLNEKIKFQTPHWPYMLSPVKVVCLVPLEKSYKVEAVITQ